MGRPDWGGGHEQEEETSEGEITGLMSEALNTRPSIKVELGIEPAAWGWQVVATLWGPGARSWQQVLLLHTCVLMCFWRVGCGSLGAWLLLTCSPHLPDLREVPCSLSLLFSLLFVFISAPPTE